MARPSVGELVLARRCLDRLVFGEILDVAQIFDPFRIGYSQLAEFHRLIKRCALRRIEIFGIEVVTSSRRLVDVCFAPDRDDPLTWFFAYLERFGRGRACSSLPLMRNEQVSSRRGQAP